MHDPMDDATLQALLDAERAAPSGLPGAVHDRLLGRVLASVAVPVAPFDASGVAEAAGQVVTSGAVASGAAGAGAVAGASGIKLWVLVGLLSAGAGVGTGVARSPAPVEVASHAPRSAEPVALAPVIVAPESVAPEVRHAPASVPASEARTEVSVLDRAVAAMPLRRSAPRLRARRAPRAVRVPRSAAPVALDQALAAERAVLAAGAQALLKGDARAALLAVRTHRRRFAEGRLVEEREVLRIRALVAAGRRAEARVVAAAFGRQFAQSVFRGAVQAALAEVEPEPGKNE